MRTIHSYVARPLGDQVLEPLTLVFDRELREAPDEPKVDDLGWRGRYAAEAAGIVGELRRVVPGGLFDALAAAFVQAIASELTVAYGNREDPPA